MRATLETLPNRRVALGGTPAVRALLNYLERLILITMRTSIAVVRAGPGRAKNIHTAASGLEAIVRTCRRKLVPLNS